MAAPGPGQPWPRDRASALVTAAEMRAIEARAAARGEPGPVLMDRAARRIAAVVAEHLGRAGGEKPVVLVLVGPGNNGGDGLWAAKYLRDRGLAVRCYCWHRPPRADDPARAAASAAGAQVVDAGDDPEGESLAWLLREADAIVDALLGFGLERPITGDLARLIGSTSAAAAKRRQTRRPLPVFAVDLPTGIDSDTGQVRGVALPASVTITLGVAKRGLYQFPGAHYAGTILLGDIGVADLTDATKTAGTTAAQVRAMLPARPVDANKGTFGSVLIVAGSLNYIGAPVLATLAAMRVGVGLATLATPFELLPMVAAKLTECTFQPLPSDMGVLSDRAAAVVFKTLQERTYKALLVGNGLGREKETLTFMRALLRAPIAAKGVTPSRGVGFSHESGGTHAAAAPRGERSVGFGSGRRVAEPVNPKEPDHAKDEATLPPLVIDADGLNLLATIEDWQGLLPENTILTPHPGEMARLLSTEVDQVQADRVKTAQQAAADWKAIVVLKGAHTVIAAPDGRIAINPAATPALATAGTGDVLAGCIAGLLAQGLDPFEAAVTGVFVHGRAGELAGEDMGDAGVLAGDVADALPFAIRDIKSAQE